MERCLFREGHGVFPAVREFLARFGDLVIAYPRKDGSTDELDFRAENAAIAAPVERVAPCSAELGVELCPVGEYYWGHFKIMIAADGQMVAAFGSLINRLGRSAEEAVENILMGNELERLRD